MPPVVTGTAQLMCSFGVAPAVLAPTNAPTITAKNMPLATVMDITPANIPTFGMCSSLANPTVASATSAASGVLTPMPCVPVVSGPWAPGATKVKTNGMAVLTVGSTCQCAWAGVITITNPGPATTVAAT